jgi:hypothetical protein
MALKLQVFVGFWFVAKLTKQGERYDERIHWSNGVGRTRQFLLSPELAYSGLQD